jgi:hypothetical protein
MPQVVHGLSELHPIEGGAFGEFDGPGEDASIEATTAGELERIARDAERIRDGMSVRGHRSAECG